MSAAERVRDDAPPRRALQSARALAMARNRLLARGFGRDLRGAVARGDHQRSPHRGSVRFVARSHSRADRDRLARARGVFRPRRVCCGHSCEQGVRRPDARARLRRRGRRRRRSHHRAAPPARSGPHAAHGDARRVAHARRTRQPQRLAHRRRGRPQFLDGAGARPVPDRLHRAAQRGALQLRRPLHPVCDRASSCPVALRARARCDPGESPARRRARHRHQPTHRCDLYGLGGLCGRGRRAAGCRPRRLSRSTCSTSTDRPTSC